MDFIAIYSWQRTLSYIKKKIRKSWIFMPLKKSEYILTLSFTQLKLEAKTLKVPRSCLAKVTQFQNIEYLCLLQLALDLWNLKLTKTNFNLYFNIHGKLSIIRSIFLNHSIPPLISCFILCHCPLPPWDVFTLK